MATHCSILAGKIPWTEKLHGGLQSEGSQRVRHTYKGCIVISSCFNLHFPEDILCGTSFHMLICNFSSLVRGLLKS